MCPVCTYILYVCTCKNNLMHCDFFFNIIFYFNIVNVVICLDSVRERASREEK